MIEAKEKVISIFLSLLSELGLSGVVYARAFLNRQTAEAHKYLLLALDRTVLKDTGHHLKFRHLDSLSVHEYCGILSWTVDQHQGQAKGIYITH